jgi:hypothetical protein
LLVISLLEHANSHPDFTLSAMEDVAASGASLFELLGEYSSQL